MQGYFLQRTAFGLDDTDGFLPDVRAVMNGFGNPAPGARSGDRPTGRARPAEHGKQVP